MISLAIIIVHNLTKNGTLAFFNSQSKNAALFWAAKKKGSANNKANFTLSNSWMETMQLPAAEQLQFL